MSHLRRLAPASPLLGLTEPLFPGWSAWSGVAGHTAGGGGVGGAVVQAVAGARPWGAYTEDCERLA